jgi:membrane protein
VLVHAQQPGTRLVTGIAGGVTLLVGASGVFGQLLDALNTVWDPRPLPVDHMVLGTGFLLLVSLLLSAAIAAAAGVLRVVGAGMAVLAQGIFSFGVTTERASSPRRTR